MEKIGSRAKVMHGNAERTGGGLIKKDLKYNKQGKIVSKKASKSAKNNNNLQKAGYFTKKGVFGAFQTGGMHNESITVNNLLNDRIKIYTQNLLAANLIGATLIHSITDKFKRTYGNTQEQIIEKIKISEEILKSIDEKYVDYCILLIEHITNEFNTRNPNNSKKQIEEILLKLNISLDIIINTKFELICKTYDKLEHILSIDSNIILMLQEIDFVYDTMIKNIIDNISNNRNTFNYKSGILKDKTTKTEGIICKNIVNCKDYSFEYGDKTIPSFLLEDYNIIIGSIHVSAFLTERYTVASSSKGVKKAQKDLKKYITNLYTAIEQTKTKGFNLLIGGDFNRLLHLRPDVTETPFDNIHEIYPITPTGFPLFLGNKSSDKIDYPGIDGFIVTDNKFNNYSAVPSHNEVIKQTLKNRRNGNNPKNYAVNKRNRLQNLDSIFVRNKAGEYTGSDHRLVELKNTEIINAAMENHGYCSHPDCLNNTKQYSANHLANHKKIHTHKYIYDNLRLNLDVGEHVVLLGNKLPLPP